MSISIHIKLSTQHLYNLCLRLYPKRMCGIFRHLKISFSFEIHTPFVCIETGRITQTGIGIQPHMGSIRQDQFIFSPPGNFQGIVLPFFLFSSLPVSINDIFFPAIDHKIPVFFFRLHFLLPT